MSKVASDGLMSSSQFARLCGVSDQTILNRVKDNKLRPAKSVGGRYFFTMENYVQFQIDSARSRVNQSFLGVIVEDSQEAVERSEAKFVSTVLSVTPKSKKIESLSTSLKNMVEAERTMDDSLFAIFRTKVISEFCLSVRKMVSSLLLELYMNVPETLKFTGTFLLDVIFNDSEIDQSLLSEFEKASCSQIRYTAKGLHNVASIDFDRLKRKFGVYSCVAEAGLSFRDVFIGNVASLNYCKDIQFGSDNSGSKVIYENLISQVASKSSQNALMSIVGNGYFTSVCSVGALTQEQEDFIVKSVIGCEYKTVVVSNSSALSSSILSLLKNSELQGKLDLIIDES